LNNHGYRLVSLLAYYQFIVHLSPIHYWGIVNKQPAPNYLQNKKYTIAPKLPHQKFALLVGRGPVELSVSDTSDISIVIFA